MGRRSGNGTRGTRRTRRPPPRLVSPDDSSFNEELIEDRYAALQAWSEWTESQKRTAGRGVAIESSPPRRSAEPSPLGRHTAGRGAVRRRSSPHRRPRPRAFAPSLNMSSRRTASSSRGSVNQSSHDRWPGMTTALRAPARRHGAQGSENRSSLCGRNHW